MRRPEPAWFWLALAALLAAGCGRKEPAPADQAQGELPAPIQRVVDSSQATIDLQKAARTINELYVLAQAGDWGTYVDRYYGETDKFASREDRDLLIERFRGEWSDEVKAALERAAVVQPEISGETAVFKVDGIPVFQLHLDANGDWKFHL